MTDLSRIIALFELQLEVLDDLKTDKSNLYLDGIIEGYTQALTQVKRLQKREDESQNELRGEGPWR